MSAPIHNITNVWPVTARSLPPREPIQSLTFVMSADKLREVALISGVALSTLDSIQLPRLREVQPENAEYELMRQGLYEECSAKIAGDKARRAFELAGKGVCVEDTGLYLPCEEGGPGPLIKAKATPGQLQKLCRDTHRSGDFRASMVVAFAYYSGFGEPQTRVARVDGEIASEPRGTKGFGWDSIFIPNLVTQKTLFPDKEIRTFAEMDAAEKLQLSARSAALTMMAHNPFLGPHRPPVIKLPPAAEDLVRRDFKLQPGGDNGWSLNHIIAGCRQVVDKRLQEIHEGLQSPEGIRQLVFTGALPERALDNYSPAVQRVMPHFDIGRLYSLSSESAARLLAREIFHMSLYFGHPIRLDTEVRLMQHGYQPVAGKGCELLERAREARTATTFKEFSLEWQGGTADQTNNERTPALKVAGLHTWISRSDLANFIMGGSMPAMSSSWAAATLAYMNVQTFAPCDGYFKEIDAQLAYIRRAFQDFKEHPYAKFGRYNNVRLSNGLSCGAYAFERGLRRIGATVKAHGEKVLPIVEKFLEAGVTRIRVYDAGANRTIAQTVHAIKRSFGDKVIVWSGNIKGIQQANECVDAGADGLIVGVAEGDQCVTAVRANIAPNNPEALYELTRSGVPVPVGVDSGVGFHGPSVVALGGAFAVRPQTLVGGTATLRPVFIRDNTGDFFHPRNGEADAITKIRGGELDPLHQSINDEGVPGRAIWTPNEPTAAHRVSIAEAGMGKGIRFARVDSLLDLQHLPVAPLVRMVGAAGAMAASHTPNPEPDDVPNNTDVQFRPLVGRGSRDT
jgi:non-canonical purine NTP pyrophosphatase (RdgB/HAM1 family)